jgi:hypothetical protein
MNNLKRVPPPTVHRCPVCQFPQTKIQRQLPDGKQGALNYVCTRTGECAVGINLGKVETWMAV